MSNQDEQQIEEIERALERLSAGGSTTAISDSLDPEVAPLFDLAARLEEELPDDLPDPAFREGLKQELLATNPPVSLSARSFRRFFSDWRFGVAAAALAGVVLIAVIFGSSTLEGNNPEPPARETVVSALSVAGKATTEPGATVSPVTVTDTKVLPPIDADHVVLVPLGLGAGSPGPSTPQPTPGITMSNALPELPQTAPTWLLTGPESSETFLKTLIARIGITGDIEAEPAAGPNAFVVTDASGYPTVHWDQHNAFFRYDRGPNEPTPPPARATTNPGITAKDWLSEIGFDLNTITYKETVQPGTGQTVVNFVPADLPATAIPPGLGATVGVGPDGSIQFAQGFWLSLAESADVPLRTSQETLDAAKNGEWYSLLPSGDTSGLNLNVSSAKMSYLLTRADDSSYLLQPVMSFTGDRWTPQGQVEDSVYVSAIMK
jgi:hypothetical protein